MEDLWMIPIVFMGVLFAFICGAVAVVDEDPQMLTNDCMLYNDVYYCPTDMPENLVMPVE